MCVCVGGEFAPMMAYIQCVGFVWLLNCAISLVSETYEALAVGNRHRREHVAVP